MQGAAPAIYIACQNEDVLEGCWLPLLDYALDIAKVQLASDRARVKRRRGGLALGVGVYSKTGCGALSDA